MSAPVERTVKVATTVDTLADAWSFVMEHVDNVGPMPQININPISVMDMADPESEWSTAFEVSVAGMVEEES